MDGHGFEMTIHDHRMMVKGLFDEPLDNADVHNIKCQTWWLADVRQTLNMKVLGPAFKKKCSSSLVTQSHKNTNVFMRRVAVGWFGGGTTLASAT